MPSPFNLCLHLLDFRIIPYFNERIVHYCGVDTIQALDEVKASRHWIRVLDTKSFTLVVWKREVRIQCIFTALVFLDCQLPVYLQVFHHIEVVDKGLFRFLLSIELQTTGCYFFPKHGSKPVKHSRMTGDKE